MIEVAFHIGGVDHQMFDDVGDPYQHIIDQNRAVRHDHALDGRMADVALMPQRDVLHRCKTISPHDTRQPAEILRGDRVPLVRHR